MALALSTVGLLAWAGLGVLAVTRQGEPAGWHTATATDRATAAAGQPSVVAPPPVTEPPVTEPPVTEPPATKAATAPGKVGVGRIGDRLTAYDESGSPRLQITVTKLKFSTGDEVDRPEHGLYMGAYVKVLALADEQDVILDTSYALVGGRRYLGEVIPISNTFDPLLGLEIGTLDRGERAAGWLVFDVPARHGQLVLHDFIDERDLGLWKY